MAATRSRPRPAAKRAPARARTKAKRKSPPRRRPRAQRPSLLEPGQGREVVGLAICALGAYTALVLWAGLDGALAGERLRDALEVAVGSVGGVMPALLVLAGLGLVLHGDPRKLRPFRIGGALLVAGLLVAVAGTSLTTDVAREEGGLVGNALRAGVETVAGDLGARVLVLFLIVAGLLLVSGGSAAVMLHQGAHAARRSARAAARASVPLSARPRSAGAPPARARRTDQPSALDGEARFPDVYADAAEGPEPERTAQPQPEPPVAEADEPEQDTLSFDAPAPLLAADDEDLSAALVHPDRPPYRLPDAGVLRTVPKVRGNGQEVERVGRVLLSALGEHGVEARLIGTVSGPRVTRYELQLAAGTKVSRVSSLRDDLAYALATTEIRILAPIPGKQAVGVEVPNRSPNLVALGDLIGEVPAGSSPLTVWLGKDIAGHVVTADLTRMPHLLIAGTTGSGKSGCINSMLCSILLRASPDEVRMILIDPKKVELNHYETIPHLLTPVVTNMKNAAAVLQNVVREMETRYEVMGSYRARNLIELNRARARAGKAPLPYMLVVIDELADLMMMSPTEVEDAVIRLAQKSRAVGIHLLLATQRPSVDVITGMIKANVPSRIAFAVSSQTDSRVILDGAGAESLLGSGDMLFKPLGTSRLQRVQGAYISEEEIALLVEQCRSQREPEMREELLEAPVVESSGDDPDALDPDQDEMLDDAILCVAQHETASVSLLQRRLRVGYTRAGRLIDMLERRGVVSGYEGSKARKVLVDYDEARRMTGRDSE